MSLKDISIYLLLFIVHDSYQISTKDSPNYIAAVVEYAPKYTTNNSLVTLKENAAAYVRHIKTASRKHADIIVFPEDGLTSIYLSRSTPFDSWTTLVPSAADNYVPCTQHSINVSETLKTISCAAKENKIYVVINLPEKYIARSCDKKNCTTSKKYYYNTNVVFDRTGKIIARYRKTNLFFEPHFDTTKVPEVVTFDTDFGVKFGVFICFDIVFEQPALNLSRILGVTDIVHSTAWFSELPFLTAIQPQFGWSFAENVNLLVAGYNRPAVGNTGSGIFLGRKGTATAVISHEARDQLLIASVPKMKRVSTEKYVLSNPVNKVFINSQQDAQGETIFTKAISHENMSKFKTVLVKSSISNTICQNGFCCKFKVQAKTNDPTVRYRIAVFNGLRSNYSATVDAGLRVCGLVQCSNDTIVSCGSDKNTTITFTTVEISGTFDNYRNMLIMPTAINTSLLPFENWTFDERPYGNKLDVTISLNSPAQHLTTFGIYSREFNKDRIWTRY